MKNEEKYKELRTMLMHYLKSCAEQKGITQQEIADKTGFTQNNISRMLQGRYTPTLDNFLRLAEAVDVFFFVEDKDANYDTAQLMKNRWNKSSLN